MDEKMYEKMLHEFKAIAAEIGRIQDTAKDLEKHFNNIYQYLTIQEGENQ